MFRDSQGSDRSGVLDFFFLLTFAAGDICPTLAINVKPKSL